MARLGQRDGQAPTPGGQFQNGSLGPVRQREVQVKVAGIVREIQVVEAGECRRGRGVRVVVHG